jgi:Concanavalin A-like lectin/glucanases superfamily
MTSNRRPADVASSFTTIAAALAEARMYKTKTFSIKGFVLVFVLLQYAATVRATLVSHYTFDEGSGTTALNSVSGAPDGTLMHSGTGSDPAYVAGVVGNHALSFVNIANNGGFVSTTTEGYPNATAGLFTGSWAFWINFDSAVPSEVPIMGGVQNRGTPANYQDVEIYGQPGGYLQAYIRAPNLDALVFTQTGGTTAIAVGGGWHHVALVYNLTTGAAGTGTGLIYVDGVAQPVSVDTNTVTSSTTFDPWNRAMKIGATNGAHDPEDETDLGITGLLDDVRVYDHLLSGTEVDDLYAMGALGTPGDFNSDDKVDAADYVIWRKNDGTNNALENDNNLGTPIGPAHYDLWRTNFGNPPGSGASVGMAASGVPEPSTGCLMALAIAAIAGTRRLRSDTPLQRVSSKHHIHPSNSWIGSGKCVWAGVRGRSTVFFADLHPLAV